MAQDKKRKNYSEKVFALFIDLKKSGLNKLILFFAFAIFLGALTTFLFEKQNNATMFANLFDAVWFAVVTIATVGYGDKFPITMQGRLVAMLLIFSGIVLTTLISGAIASIFVERKIKEGKGLQEIHNKGHILLCGWNSNGENTLNSIFHSSETKKSSVVLVNFIESERFEALKTKYHGFDLSFVRGDFSSESILKRAACESARAAIFIPDELSESGSKNSDEKTILAVLALKSMNPNLEFSAELLHKENEAHLRRAGVTDIVISGEFTGFLLSSGATSEGIPKLVRTMLSVNQDHSLKQIQFPNHLIGKRFDEASTFFLSNSLGILVGILSKEQKVSMTELLSDDSSAIDQFIKRKFKEADIDISKEGFGESEVKLNPGSHYIIKSQDLAFIIG